MEQYKKTQNKILQVTVACMKLNKTFADMISDENVLSKPESQAISLGKDMDFIAHNLADIANESAKIVSDLAGKMAMEGRYE